MRYLLYVLGWIKNMRKPTSPPNTPRANGLSCPPHPYQIFVWITLLFVQLAYFGTIIPSLPETLAMLAYASNFTLMFLHLVTHMWCLVLNPADINVLKNWGTNRKAPSFDRTQHRHVIEDQFCHICNVYVGKYTKHCSRCNKCVADFDHHCKWLNTCIGGRNYICFLLCLASAWIGCLLIALVSTTAPTMYFVDRTWLRPFRPTNTAHKDAGLMDQTDFNYDGNVTTPSTLNGTGSKLSPPTDIGPSFTFFAPVSDVTWLTVSLLTAGLTALATALVGHLLFFHIYLVCQGLSTYQLVLRQRELEMNPKMASMIPVASGSQPSNLPCHSSCQQVFNCPSKDKPLKNQVSPALHHHGMVATNTPSSTMGPTAQGLNEGFSESPTINRTSLPQSINNSPNIAKSALIAGHKRRDGSLHSTEAAYPSNTVLISSNMAMPTVLPHIEKSAASCNTVRVNPLSINNDSNFRASYPPIHSGQSITTRVQPRSNSERNLTSLDVNNKQWEANSLSYSCSATPQHHKHRIIHDYCDKENIQEQDTAVPHELNKQYCWQEPQLQIANKDEQVIAQDKTLLSSHSSMQSLENTNQEEMEVNIANSEGKMMSKDKGDDKEREVSQDIQKRWAYQLEIAASDSAGPAWRSSSHHSYYPKWENKSPDVLVTRWSFPTKANQFPTPVQTHEKWTPMLNMGNSAVVYDHHQNLQEVLL